MGKVPLERNFAYLEKKRKGMKKNWRSMVLIFLFASALISFAFFANGQKPIKEAAIKVEPPKRIDADKNKIFDDLEEKLRGKNDQDSQAVILVFDHKFSAAEEAEISLKINNKKSTHRYNAIPGAAITLSKREINDLASSPLIKQIEDDAEIYPFLDNSAKWFGAQKAKTDFGIDGNADGSASYSKDDIVAAVLDSGIDPGHIDLDGGKIIGWKDFATGLANPYDQVSGCDGHGTHVSSMIAGTGEGNALYKGVAPGAALVGVKVLKKQGGNCTGTVSDINAGIQWVIDNKATLGIEIMNMSLGGTGCSDGTDSLSLMVNSAVAAGITAIVAAGNEGPGTCTISSPAAAADAITVGVMADVTPMASNLSYTCGTAPNKGFYLACFSSRGPTADGRIKPDIAGPGVGIMAAQAGTASSYIQYSGTSMSAPFTAGVAALMLDANPSLTPAQIKSILKSTAKDWGPAGADIDYGAGRLDGYEAIKSAGSFTGTNIIVPDHQFISDSLPNTSDAADWYDINAVNADYPIAITMIMPNWASSSNPDFDMKLYLADGTTQVAASEGTNRQETIGYQPSVAGIYKLKVYRFAGSGNYFFDQSARVGIVSITLTTDGSVNFGTVALNASKDTTPSGINDPETVRVDTGPADLFVRSGNFSDGANIWTLGTANGNNQIKWEFSKDAASWTAFAAAGTNYSFDSAVPESDTRDLNLRLTLPTSTSSNNAHSAAITIVATTP